MIIERKSGIGAELPVLRRSTNAQDCPFCDIRSTPVFRRRHRLLRIAVRAYDASKEKHRNDAMDIGAWLRGLGLERYEQAFRDNEIDQRILPELTADDLKELGVGAIGPGCC